MFVVCVVCSSWGVCGYSFIVCIPQCTSCTRDKAFEFEFEFDVISFVCEEFDRHMGWTFTHALTHCGLMPLIGSYTVGYLSSLILIMACRLFGAKPLLEPVVVVFCEFDENISSLVFNSNFFSIWSMEVFFFLSQWTLDEIKLIPSRRCDDVVLEYVNYHYV